MTLIDSALIRSSMNPSDVRARACIVKAFSCAIFSGHVRAFRFPYSRQCAKMFTNVSVYDGHVRS